MTIAKSTRRHDVWASIYGLLSSNIASSTATITAAYPPNNNSFPIIVVNPVISTATNETIGALSEGIKEYLFNVIIEVYASKAKDLDTICDTILNLLLTTEIDSELHNIEVEDGTADYTFVNNSTVRMKPIAVSFTMGK